MLCFWCRISCQSDGFQVIEIPPVHRDEISDLNSTLESFAGNRPSRQKRGSLIRPVQLPAYLLEHARLAGYGAVDSLFVSCVEVWP